MVDKAKLIADMDAASAEFLAKVDGVAMVALIARGDGSLMLSKSGQGMMTDVQLRALNAANAIMAELAERAGCLEMLLDREGVRHHGKPVRLN